MRHWMRAYNPNCRRNSPISRDEDWSLIVANQQLLQDAYRERDNEMVARDLQNAARDIGQIRIRHARDKMINPGELLIIGANPRKGVTKMAKAKRKISKIRYRGKLFSRARLLRKLGKRMGARVWAKRKGTRIAKKGAKRLSAPKGSWMALVKRKGIQLAAKMWRKRGHKRTGKRARRSKSRR